METTIKVKVSDQERDLLLLIQRIGYGDILNVEIVASEPNSEIATTEAMRSLLEMIRDGNQSIERIMVHQQEPQYAEVRGDLFGFQYRKRFKFVH